MKNLFDIAPLLPYINQQALILTPNRRLAAKALSAYSAYCTAQGQRAWLTPRIQSLESWIQHCWQELQDQPGTLSDTVPESIATALDSRQELALWEQVVQSATDTDLLTPAGAAAQCQSAYRSLRLWQLSVEHEDYRTQQLTPDLFGTWVRDFEGQLLRRKHITQYDLAEQLTGAFQQGSLPRENQLLLLDFQEPAPLYQALIQAACSKLADFSAPSINQQAGFVRCADPKSELELVAQWARQVLRSSQSQNQDEPQTQNPQPSARIGIVVPDLHNQRQAVVHTFRKVFESDHLLPHTAAVPPGFNLSIGEPLAQTAIIYHALELLRLCFQPLPHQQLGLLLYSPFAPYTQGDMADLVTLEQQLRFRPKHQYRLGELIFQAERLLSRQPLPQTPSGPAAASNDGPQQMDLLGKGPVPEAVPVTPSALQQLLDCLKRLQDTPRPKRASASVWSQWFYELLRALGWPGTRQCNSLEYQQLDQWFELLGSLSRFDDLQPALSLREAFALVRKETQAALFQPQTPDSPVQILGPLEAAGLQFSHLWVMGMSDDAWPPAPAPHPLLPVPLQRDHNMPHATPERELEFCRVLTQGYQQNAEISLFSFPALKDEKSLRASTLISHLPALPPEQLPLHLNASKYPEPYQPEATLEQLELPQPSPLQAVATDQAPAVSREERDNLKGGSSLIKNQALCPFSGFAIHRLNARPLEQPSTGLTPADRGNMLHQVLELFWQRIETQARLQALTEPQLHELLNELCQQALAPYRRHADAWMQQRFWQLEQRRLLQLLLRWMEVERQRPPFSVLATEQTLKAEIAGLPLTLRIDRIDRLEDGSTLLVDYKTGNPNRRSWAGERPDEPQLPLYAIASRKDVSALAFATINAGTQAFQGIADDLTHQSALGIAGIDAISQQKTGLPSDWQHTLDSWQLQLNRLVQDFLQGLTPVAPINNQPDKAYAYSGLEPLNRIYEFELLATEDEAS